MANEKIKLSPNSGFVECHINDEGETDRVERDEPAEPTIENVTELAILIAGDKRFMRSFAKRYPDSVHRRLFIINAAAAFTRVEQAQADDVINNFDWMLATENYADLLLKSDVEYTDDDQLEEFAQQAIDNSL